MRAPVVSKAAAPPGRACRAGSSGRLRRRGSVGHYAACPAAAVLPQAQDVYVSIVDMVATVKNTMFHKFVHPPTRMRPGEPQSSLRKHLFTIADHGGKTNNT
ncbi:unnamed protein product [Prorocentrum cordatum]|uniref:Uncharacterized protein n=1 Tax=Prorocentrum cordatum TaxID=2364126 RepID=A0ABN9UQA7_9DINO|nr:unnamed protein product [Polarella glacialis]